jgi:hypothetical protein
MVYHEIERCFTRGDFLKIVAWILGYLSYLLCHIELVPCFHDDSSEVLVVGLVAIPHDASDVLAIGLVIPRHELGSPIGKESRMVSLWKSHTQQRMKVAAGGNDSYSPNL